MMLPLLNVDDRWGLVALDHIPKCGFRVPGLSVFIPGDVLGRAASTAVERKVKVSIPFHCQLKDKLLKDSFMPGCGVYGNPQLPRHVFVGPFPAKHFENCSLQPCVMPISLTTPSDSSSLETFCVKTTEPALSSANLVAAEKKEEQPGGNLAASFDF